MDFREWKAAGPVRSRFSALRMATVLAESHSWQELRENVIAHNDAAHGNGHFVDAVRRSDSVCSSGERVLLHAIAYVCDFAWLADELDTDEDDQPGCGRAWRRMDRASGEHRACVAACIGAPI